MPPVGRFVRVLVPEHNLLADGPLHGVLERDQDVVLWGNRHHPRLKCIEGSVGGGIVSGGVATFGGLCTGSQKQLRPGSKGGIP